MSNQAETYERWEVISFVIIAIIFTVLLTLLSFKFYAENKFEIKCTKANGVVLRNVCLKKEFVALTE